MIIVAALPNGITGRTCSSRHEWQRLDKTESPKTKLLRGSFEPLGSEIDVKFSHVRSLASGLGQWQVAMSGEVWNHVMSCVLKALKGTHSNTSSNSIQDFRKENMTVTQIAAHHDTTSGCPRMPTSCQPKVTTGAMLFEQVGGRTNCHHLRNSKVRGKEQTQSARAVSIQTHLSLNISASCEV